MKRVLIPLELSSLPPPAGAELYTLQGETMGTTWSVRVAGPKGFDSRRLQLEIQQQLDAVVAEMSTWTAASDISSFNQAAAGSWQTLPADFFHVLDYALSVARDSDGAFDPSVGALVNLWGFGPDAKRSTAPALADIAAAQSRCGWQKIELDALSKRIRQTGGIYLDLSGVAKGFAVDKLSVFLHAAAFPHHLVEVGGELRGRGMRPDGHPWWVALEQAPVLTLDTGTALPVETIIALHDLSVATSGDYRKFFEAEGRRFAHTLDPRTGLPVAHQLAAVTVLHESCMQADAQATALTVLGVEAGMAYARRHHLAALFVSRGEKGFDEHMTPAFAALLE